MTSAAVVSLAILMVNWDQRKQDYLQTFVPMLAECLRLSPNEVVSLPSLRDDLRSRFGLAMPHSVLERLLGRVKRAGYVTRDEGPVYRPNRSALAGLDFRRVQQQVMVMHEAVVEELVKFQSKRYEAVWDRTEAEAALHSYLESEQVSFLAATTAERAVPLPREAGLGARYIVAMFVQHLHDVDPGKFDYLVTIAKGNMLAQAVFLPDPTQTSRRFRNTTVYLDTTLLLNALGYNGEARKAPCVELLELLYRAGAELRCFTHTLNETRGVLYAVAEDIADAGPSDRFNTATEYFIQTGHTASEVLLYAATLEKDLHGLRVTMVDTPSYGPDDRYKYVIDETKLGEVLAEEIRYRRDGPRMRDVDSISAIMRLREGKVAHLYEDSRALFVTTNAALARACISHFRDEDVPDAIPPCVSDRDLTTLLWLKMPSWATDLPRKRLIADCYAAMQPEPHLWHRYLQEIERLKERRLLTVEDVILVRHSIEAKQALMERTLGEESAFVQGTVTEILEATRRHIQEELQGELGVASQQRDEQKGRADRLEEKDAKRRGAIRNRAASFAAGVTNVVAWLLFAILLLCALGSIVVASSAPRQSLGSYAVTAAIVVGAGVYAYGLTWGGTVKGWLRGFEVGISNWLERRLTSLIES